MSSNRALIILAAALITLCGSLVALGATLDEQARLLRGYVDPLQTADLPYRIPLLGVNADLRQYQGSALRQQLNLMREAQITWVRQFVFWDQVQPSAASALDWSIYDPIIGAFAGDPQLRLVLVLMNSPDWSRDPALAPTAPPDQPAKFANFARELALRYGDVVDHYQIWDEPNLTDAWGGTEPSPAGYAGMLAAAYQAIHANDPQAVVIAAALAPTTEDNLRNISDITYLRALYQLDAQDYFDAAAAKPYGFSEPADALNVSAEALNFPRIIALREVMEAYGDSRKHLWGSAWGWNSLPDGWQGNASIWGQVTAAQQAEYTLRALERAEEQWAWAGGLILQHWQPSAPETDAVWGFSLRSPEGSPTPLYDALSSRPRSDGAVHGLHRPDTIYASYSGVWTFGELGADIGWLSDSRFTFRFRGSGVGLLLRRGDYVAFLYPSIDGNMPSALPRDPDGRAFITLKSADLQPALELQPIAVDLSPGTHQLEVIADRGWDQWALAGIAVASQNPAAPLDAQIIVAIISSLIALSAVSISAFQANWQTPARLLKAALDRLGDLGQLAVSIATSLALMIGMLLTWGDGVPALFRREPVQLGIAILTAGIVYLSPGILLTLAAAAVLFVIFFHKPELGALLTLLFAPFFLFPVELWRFAFPMSEVLLLLTAAAWGLGLLVKLGRQRQALPRSLTTFDGFRVMNAMDYGVLAFALIGVLSLAWTSIRAPAVTEVRTLILEPVIFYAILRTRCETGRMRLSLVDTLIISGILVSLIGLFQFMSGTAVITAEDGARRLSSVYGSPNNVGLWLGRCLPFALAFMVVSVDRRRRLLAAGTVLLMGITALLTQSAGAIFIGIPVGILAVALLALKRQRVLILSGVAIAVAALFAVAVQSERFSRLLSLTEGTNFFRLRVWQSAFSMIRERIVTGFGMDQFLYEYRGRYMLPDAWQEPNLSHPHNLILDVWTRLGLLGLAAIVWTQIVFWRTALRIYRVLSAGDRVSFAIMVGTIGSMAALLSHGMIDNSIFVQDLIFAYMLLLWLPVSAANIRAIDGEQKTML
jgi:O-antigen ligase